MAEERNELLDSFYGRGLRRREAAPHSTLAEWQAWLQELAEEAHAEEIAWFPVAGHSPIADAFFICSGRSRRHTISIAESMKKQLKASPQWMYGSIDPTGEWHILDCGSVVVHIVLPETRTYYALDTLWQSLLDKEAFDG